MGALWVCVGCECVVRVVRSKSGRLRAQGFFLFFELAVCGFSLFQLVDMMKGRVIYGRAGIFLL